MQRKARGVPLRFREQRERLPREDTRFDQHIDDAGIAAADPPEQAGGLMPPVNGRRRYSAAAARRFDSAEIRAGDRIAGRCVLPEPSSRDIWRNARA